MVLAVPCLHESQALAFVAGTLGAGERESALEHVDDCATCRQLLSELVRKHASTDRDIATGETLLAIDRNAALAQADEWVAGTRIGRYVVLAKIGRGGMGTVFRAEDVELGRPAASVCPARARGACSSAAAASQRRDRA